MEIGNHNITAPSVSDGLNHYLSPEIHPPSVSLFFAAACASMSVHMCICEGTQECEMIYD